MFTLMARGSWGRCPLPSGEQSAIHMVKFDEESLVSSQTGTTVEDLTIAQELTAALLTGSGYSGFSFDTNFSLRFVVQAGSKFRSFALPQMVELQIFGRWRVGDADSWRKKTERLADWRAAEPEEAVQAYELASLRWQEGTVVESVLLKSEETVIRFLGGQTIVIPSVDHESWLLCVTEKTIDTAWSVACEGRTYFARIPTELSTK